MDYKVTAMGTALAYGGTAIALVGAQQINVVPGALDPGWHLFNPKEPLDVWGAAALAVPFAAISGREAFRTHFHFRRFDLGDHDPGDDPPAGEA